MEKELASTAIRNQKVFVLLKDVLYIQREINRLEGDESLKAYREGLKASLSILNIPFRE